MGLCDFLIQVQGLSLDVGLAAVQKELANQLGGAAACILDGRQMAELGAVFVLVQQQQLGIAVDHLDQVVEVVGDASGQVAHGLHFLGMQELFAQGIAFPLRLPSALDHGVGRQGQAFELREIHFIGFDLGVIPRGRA